MSWPRTVTRRLTSIIRLPASAALGLVAYFLLSPVVAIDLSGQVSPAMYAFASVMGVVAGFAGTAAVFIAGTNGLGIDQLRRTHRTQLTNALLAGVGVLGASAFGLVFCGLFANGWGARFAACGFLTLPLFDVLLIALATRVAMNSSGVAAPNPQSDDQL